jgi:hypothetical protein
MCAGWRGSGLLVTPTLGDTLFHGLKNAAKPLMRGRPFLGLVLKKPLRINGAGRTLTPSV